MSETPTPTRLGKITEVRVRVGYDVPRGGAEREVALLDVPLGDVCPPDLEARLLEAVAPLALREQVHYTVSVERTYTNRGSGEGHLGVHVSLANGDRHAEAHRAGVADYFSAVLRLCGVASSPDLHRNEALTRARVRVAQAFPPAHAESLAVSGEDRVDGGYRFGLVTPERDRFSVVVGIVDGYAGSAQVRHLPPAEVFDSVGAE